MVGTHLELINPPPDVQSAVAGVIHACSDWRPTEVPNRPPLPHTEAGIAITLSVSEAQVCSFIQDPYAQVIFALEMGGMIAVMLIVVVWMTRIYRLPGVLWRLALRLIPRRAMGR